LPDGEYTLNRNIKGFGKVDSKAIVKDGIFTLLSGSRCGKAGTGYIPLKGKGKDLFVRQ